MKKTGLFLIGIILLGLLIIACGDAGDTAITDPSGAGNAAQNDSAEVNDDTTTAKILPDVPDTMDYERYEFTFLGNSTGYNSYWYSKDLYTEEATGDAINDAVYNRNLAIEEKYNIKINAVLSAGQYNDAQKDIAAGTNTYDAFSVALQGPTARLAQEGMLLDLKEIPYIDLEKPWWDQKANAQLSINNKLMFTINDLLIIDKDALFIFLFNKDVIEELSLENPYELVRDGKWTIDKMWDMAKDVSRDIDGDGVMGETDAYRMLTAAHTIHGNVVGSGHFVITKDSKDLPVINIQDPMIEKSYEKWITMINDRANTWVAQDWDKNHADIWMYQLEVLSEKRGLWLYAGMDRVTTLRTFDFNFGILPNPKFDEAQTEYYNHVHAWCTTAISVPITTIDQERTGMILEALTAESYYTLRPAYYELSLKTKFMRDDESGEMLDLIFSTRCYDLGHVYNWGGVFDMFSNMPQQKKTNLVSEYEKILPKMEADMQKAIDNFLDIE